MRTRVEIIQAETRLTAEECCRSWSVLYRHALRVRSRYSGIREVAPADSIPSILAPFLEGSVAMTLLDVGASDPAEMRDYVTRAFPSVEYKSLDIDRNTSQDYYSWEEVDRSFERILCTEVVEHLTPKEGLDLFERVWERLTPGGVFLVGTPNIFNPTRYLQDPTHKTPWCYDRLAGALLAQGFDILAIRRYGGLRRPRGLKDRIVSRLTQGIAWRLGLDPAHSICVVARRPPAPGFFGLVKE